MKLGPMMPNRMTFSNLGDGAAFILDREVYIKGRFVSYDAAGRAVRLSDGLITCISPAQEVELLPNAVVLPDGEKK